MHLSQETARKAVEGKQQGESTSGERGCRQSAGSSGEAALLEADVLGRLEGSGQSWTEAKMGSGGGGEVGWLD